MVQTVPVRYTFAGREGVSPVGVAAMVAVLHLAVLSARVPRHGHHRPVSFLSWEAPVPATTTEATAEPDAPSNPTQAYCVGQICLTFGMAVVALANLLHIMRAGAARGY